MLLSRSFTFPFLGPGQTFLARCGSLSQRQAAVAGKITRVMQQAARAEGVAPEILQKHLAEGTLVVAANKRHRGLKPIAIGADVRVKVNANIAIASNPPVVKTAT